MNSTQSGEFEQRSPFADATGLGVRVAVIDSGVNPRHPHITAVAGGVSVMPDGPVEEGVYTDLVGHGTAVMAAIQGKAPAAEYYAVRVFYDSPRTSAATLVRAIEWCVEQRMDVINLSLGTLNSDHVERFLRVVAKAGEAGSLLVAARDADGKLCYPGCLPGVIGVGLDWECPEDQYRCRRIDGETVFFASGYPRSAPGVPRARNLNGISFSVANLTGFIVRACEAERGKHPASPGVQAVRGMLERQASDLKNESASIKILSTRMS